MTKQDDVMNKETITHFFETLHKEVSIESFSTIYDDAVVFKDPFNEVSGVKAVHGIFEHMYNTLDRPRFIIKEYIDNQNVAYVKWDFIFSFKGEKKETGFEGVSRLEMNEEGKVISHVDFWDASEHIYEKMPLLGSVLRFVKKKIQHGTQV
ncbi:MAG: nuclear transport factor 2 family protein [Sulfurovum sp.]|uniref:nuclear transport factor 2 family protein n=1 Tax=Sulfurovum sp. TaxID=1969726 RepID=UPI002867B0EC|nr:nuclear transport factor 2 family protein [Sulfurovum sp.]MCO4845111.1 nuclear transport factor 2 family protein [Sulfurovum sp.]